MRVALNISITLGIHVPYLVTSDGKGRVSATCGGGVCCAKSARPLSCAQCSDTAGSVVVAFQHVHSRREGVSVNESVKYNALAHRPLHVCVSMPNVTTVLLLSAPSRHALYISYYYTDRKRCVRSRRPSLSSLPILAAVSPAVMRRLVVRWNAPQSVRRRRVGRRVRTPEWSWCSCEARQRRSALQPP